MMSSRPSFIALAALLCAGCFNQSSPPSGVTIDASTGVVIAFDTAKGDGSTPALRWNIAAIAANFDQATFSTQYTVAISGNTQGSTMQPLPGAMTVSWSLQLKLVEIG